MRPKKSVKVIQFCAHEHDIVLIERVKSRFGISSDSEAVRFLLRNPDLLLSPCSEIHNEGTKHRQLVPVP